MEPPTDFLPEAGVIPHHQEGGHEGYADCGHHQRPGQDPDAPQVPVEEQIDPDGEEPDGTDDKDRGGEHGVPSAPEDQAEGQQDHRSDDKDGERQLEIPLSPAGHKGDEVDIEGGGARVERQL
ncbi:hypothetical protein SDC9_91655 [bioreactor metagenome]|uniref:Uncharacterized protein n=1 Tax=bioreactor metagenome TaxID=1076179 RepID=A0A644ZVH9_9ZZZZ